MKKYLVLFALFCAGSVFAATASDAVITPKKDGGSVYIIGTSSNGTPTTGIVVNSAGAVLRSGVVTKTTSYTILDGDGFGYILADTSSGAVNITLPTAGTNIGRQITVEHKSGDANNACVIPADQTNDRIDGSSYTTNFCLNDGGKITLMAFSANQWKVVNPTMMSSAEAATRAGLYRYNHGTTYNGGNAPTVSGTGVTVTRAAFFPYQMFDGTWRVKYSIYYSKSAHHFVGLSIAGITNAYEQACAIAPVGGTNYQGATCWIPSGTNTIEANFSADFSGGTIWADIALSAKPSWAY